MAQDLPQELLALIIDGLGDDKKGLAACSSVCVSWSAYAQASLWREVYLGKYKHTPNSLAQFPTAMRDCPRLVDNIRTLSLDHVSAVDSIVAELQCLPRLETLKVAHCAVHLRVDGGAYGRR